jgi:hypothetical protein
LDGVRPGVLTVRTRLARRAYNQRFRSNSERKEQAEEDAK